MARSQRVALLSVMTAEGHSELTVPSALCARQLMAAYMEGMPSICRALVAGGERVMVTAMTTMTTPMTMAAAMPMMPGPHPQVYGGSGLATSPLTQPGAKARAVELFSFAKSYQMVRGADGTSAAWSGTMEDDGLAALLFEGVVEWVRERVREWVDGANSAIACMRHTTRIHFPARSQNSRNMSWLRAACPPPHSTRAQHLPLN